MVSRMPLLVEIQDTLIVNVLFGIDEMVSSVRVGHDLGSLGVIS